MGFVLPAMLFGFGAVALPILVHFIRARKYQLVRIGTLRFLEAAIRERRRWRRIEDWPLLLARILLVALTVLLFARPFFAASGDARSGNLEAILLIDVSGSVSGPHFAAVREAARHALDRVPTGARVTLAAFADDVKVVKDLAALEAIPGAATDYVRAVDWTLDRAAQSDRDRVEVFWVTDMQRAALPESPPRVWPAKCHAEVIPVAPSGDWNAAVTGERLLTPYHAQSAELEAEVSFFGKSPDRRWTLRWTVAGSEPRTSEVETESGWQRFRWEPGSAVAFEGAVSLASDDAYPVDDSRPIAGELAPRANVLLVEGAQPATPFEGDAYFLEKALGVPGSANGPSAFAARIGPLPAALDGLGAIALCNVPGVEESQARALANFVRNGGGLAIFLVPRTDPSGFAALARAGVFPENVRPVDVQAPRPIEWWDAQSPLLAAFGDAGETGDLRRVVLRDAFDVSGPGWRAAAKLPGGRAALLTRDVGKGRVLVFANPVTREWSDFPQERIFLPLMREWFGWLVNTTAKEIAPITRSPGLHEPRAPGVYAEGGRRVVVAADPAESDIATVTPDVFRRSLGLPEARPAADAAEPEPAGLPRTRERPREWWPWLVVAVLALMTLENHLADRSRHARVA